MGAAGVSLPVQTEFTNAERNKQDRRRPTPSRAAEQCGGNLRAGRAELQRLDRVLADWPEDRRLIYADEGGRAWAQTLAEIQRRQMAILIGPEAAFRTPTRARLRRLSFARP